MGDNQAMKELMMMVIADEKAVEVICGNLDTLFKNVPGYSFAMVIFESGDDPYWLAKAHQPKLVIVDLDNFFMVTTSRSPAKKNIRGAQILAELRARRPQTWTIGMGVNGSSGARACKDKGMLNQAERQMRFAKLTGKSYCGLTKFQIALKRFLDAMQVPNKIPPLI